MLHEHIICFFLKHVHVPELDAVACSRDLPRLAVLVLREHAETSDGSGEGGGWRILAGRVQEAGSGKWRTNECTHQLDAVII